MVIEIFFPSQSGNVIFNTSSNKANPSSFRNTWLYSSQYFSFLFTRPRNRPFAQRDFQNEGKSGWTGTSSFVLEVPLRNLRPSVIYSVPCDRIVQRDYTLHSYYVVRSSQTALQCGEQTQDEFFRELHKTLYFAKVPTYLFGKIFIRLIFER